jgi:hypothetical protein
MAEDIRRTIDAVALNGYAIDEAVQDILDIVALALLDIDYEIPIEQWTTRKNVSKCTIEQAARWLHTILRPECQQRSEP